MAMVDWDVGLLCVCFLLGWFAGGGDGLGKREIEERETGRERGRIKNEKNKNKETIFK